MRSIFRRFLLSSLALIPLAACADQPSPDSTGVFDNPALALSVDQQLAQSTSETAQSLKTLELIQRSRNVVAPPIDQSHLPPELLTRVTELNWSGPADQLVHDIANTIGYGYSTEGAPPVSPPFVSVTIDHESAATAFEDVGLQVQQFATVVVDPNARHVTFRYETYDPSNAAPVGPAPTGHHRARVRRDTHAAVHAHVRHHTPAAGAGS